MKTVQEHLKQANIDNLINAFYYKYPAKLDDFADDVTIAQAKKYNYDSMYMFIENLKKTPITPNNDDKTWIFYVYHNINDYMPEPIFNLTPLKELKELGSQAYSYAYEFTPQAEVLGYFIAENKLTTYYLEDLLVEILYEMSFFGLKQEELPVEKTKLDEQIKEFKATNPNQLSVDDFLENTKLDHFTAEEKVYEKQAFDAKMTLGELSMKRAIKEICKNK
ncbi:DUF6557 family protein [Ligilactobacillus equi]|uniref:Uncharacterized protein n=1 Tax=Ligilactobacillus equi DSM 15833 = JCM 10991 TaxID=1423740 RepID=A0A0R1TDU0_9LACO|nr:DUF6557 family protein [Ligilactobacillus equi]KRL78260.1 hypothetical protein FC36_GL001101 [Ligilactobacillus equi DSM 15833 = JCM 10991]